ncbi:HK97 family phage prohead protease [Cryobacterium fucosi]|uniref:HK97 family phage prohead protease n=1 Tax=Cryobacterium fucosi TaxID=1259157 RepID=UPI00141B8BF4|nr:HK97 family phage prohead protease [Cryobacterium fucosi]
MHEIEKRNTAQPVEFRASDTGAGVLTGYAAVFNRYSQNLGGFVEQVAPGAFNKSLGDATPVIARYNHNDDFLLGTTEAGTLTLTVDGTGLRYDVELPDTTAGRDVAALAKRGDLRYSSFAFRALDDDWGVTDQGFPFRTLLNVQLVDVAPVNTPAYMDTTAGMRSLAERLHMEVDEVRITPVEEIRSLLSVEKLPPESRAEPESKDGQSETHPTIAMLRRRLDMVQSAPVSR